MVEAQANLTFGITFILPAMIIAGLIGAAWAFYIAGRELR